jgi:hypothetical protein
MATGLRFVNAVKVGEAIAAIVEVASVRDDKPICTLETTIRNDDGKACVTVMATTYTMPLLAEYCRGTASLNHIIARITGGDADPDRSPDQVLLLAVHGLVLGNLPERPGQAIVDFHRIGPGFSGGLPGPESRVFYR